MKSAFAFVISLLALAACGGGLAPPDMKDPASVAKAFVDAFNARDLQHMLPLHDQLNMDAISDAIAGGPGSEAYEGIFAPEMVQLLAREGGRIEGPRYDRRDAVVKVGKSDAGDVFTVVLEKDKDKEWNIVAHSVMGEAQFLALPDQPKR